VDDVVAAVLHRALEDDDEEVRGAILDACCNLSREEWGLVKVSPPPRASEASAKKT
jgi:hypothetical protein